MAVRLLEGIILAGVYGALLLPLMYFPGVSYPFVFPKAIFFQVLIDLTFPAYAVLAFLRPSFRPRRDPFPVAIGAWFVALSVSAIFAVDPLRAWWGSQERMGGLFTLLHFLAWFMMAAGALKSWENWRRLLVFEAAVCAAVAGTAAAQMIWPWLLAGTGGRAGGLLGNPIYLAAYLVCNLFLLAALFMKTRSTAARVAYAALALLDAAAFIGAQSRGPLVGLGAGVVVFVLWYSSFTKNRKARSVVLGLAAALFLAYGLLFLFHGTEAVQGSPFRRLVDTSFGAETRLTAWRTAWNGYRERPIFGWGLDNYHILFNLHYEPISLRHGLQETWFDRSHNVILDAVSMTGTLGLLAFLGIFAALVWSVGRACRRKDIAPSFSAFLVALPAAYLVQNLFAFDSPSGLLAGFLSYALAASAARPGFTVADAPAATAAKVGAGSWIALAALEVFFMFVAWQGSVLPFKAAVLTVKANDAFSTPEGLRDMRAAAVTSTPYLEDQSFLFSRKILAYADRGMLAGMAGAKERYAIARRQSKEHASRHAHDTQALFNYAGLLGGMLALVPQDAPEAEKYYLLAMETSPKRQQLLLGLANLYLREGRVNEAAQLYRTVRDLDPEWGDAHWTYGLVLMYYAMDSKGGASEIASSQATAFPHAL